MKGKHPEIIADMLGSYDELLASLLMDGGDRTAVGYQKAHDEVYGTYDRNHQERFRVLTAIRFKGKAEYHRYEALIRFLLEQEIIDRETNSFQGFGEPLELAVWLLKRFERAPDKELFERAKQANFDTHCGFDFEGLDEDYFSEQPEALDSEEAVWLAMDLGEEHYAEHLLGLWKEAQQNWNEKNLKWLRFVEKARGHKEGELWTLEQLFELKKEHLNDWDFSSLARDLAVAYLELGRMGDAYAIISQIIPRIVRVNEWQGVGLGRFILESCADFVLAGDAETEVAQVWQFCKQNLERMAWAHWNLYEKAAKAAAKMAEPEFAREMERRLEEAKQA